MNTNRKYILLELITQRFSSVDDNTELAKLLGFSEAESKNADEVGISSVNSDKDEVTFEVSFNDGTVDERVESIESMFNLLRPIYYGFDEWNQIENIDKDSVSDDEFSSRVFNILNI